MKKTLLFLGLSATVALSSCNNSTTTNNQSATADTAHNSKNALDWEGTYQGLIPCASCPGISSIIALDDDGSYELLNTYLEEESSFVEKGKFNWDAKGSFITLDNEAKSKLKVAENSVIMLDADGKEPEGAMADRYHLKKLSGESDLDDAFIKQVYKGNDDGVNYSVSRYTQGNKNFAKIEGGKVDETLTQDPSVSEYTVYKKGNYVLDEQKGRLTLTSKGKKQKLTMLSPIHSVYKSGDKVLYVSNYNYDDDHFVVLLKEDGSFLKLDQKAAASKAADYSDGKVQWSVRASDKASLTENGQETTYTEQ